MEQYAVIQVVSSS